MAYEANLIYHVFNQGNNKEKIFFEERNYHYFLEKMIKNICPYADFLAYCLMPNHFHWLLVPKDKGCERGKSFRAMPKYVIPGVEESAYQQKLSEAIGLTLSSYTKGINKAYNRSGSLFRAKTKSKNGWIDGVVTLGSKYEHLMFKQGNDYAITCFEYIHNNPVKAKLVSKKKDWIYSSAGDYLNIRDSGVCNYDMAKKYLRVIKG